MSDRAPSLLGARCVRCGRHSSQWKNGRGASAYCEQCRKLPPTPSAAAPVPARAKLPQALAAWRDANICRIVIDTGSGIEIRIVDGAGAYSVACFPTGEAAVRAIKTNDETVWRHVKARESKQSDCMPFASIAVSL